MPATSQMLMIAVAVGGALAAWAGVTVTVVMFLWNKLDKRFDELQEEQKELRSDLKAGLAKLDDRQREDNKALNEKLDRLLESRLPAPR